MPSGRRRRRSRLSRLGIASALAAALLLGATAGPRGPSRSASSPRPNPASETSADTDRAQPSVISGNSYVVPATGGITAWTLTSWSHNAAADLGQELTMKVFRKVADPLTYTVVGHDGPRASHAERRQHVSDQPPGEGGRCPRQQLEEPSRQRLLLPRSRRVIHRHTARPRRWPDGDLPAQRRPPTSQHLRRPRTHQYLHARPDHPPQGKGHGDAGGDGSQPRRPDRRREGRQVRGRRDRGDLQGGQRRPCGADDSCQGQEEAQAQRHRQGQGQAQRSPIRRPGARPTLSRER